MAGLAIVLDLLRKNQSLNKAEGLHSHGLFSAASAASAAAATVASGAPFAFRAFLGYVSMREYFRCSCIEFGFVVMDRIEIELDSFVEIYSFEEVEIVAGDFIYSGSCKI